MRLVTRKRIVLGLAVILAIALLGRWWMRDGDPASMPARAAPQLATDSAPIAEPSKLQAAPPVTTPSPAGGIFRGRVIDAVTRTPVREFEVQIHTQESMRDAVPDVRPFRTTDGRFELRELRGEVLMLAVAAKGYQRFDLLSVALTSDLRKEVEIAMRGGHVLTGRVFDQMSGDGIADARVAFRDSNVPRYDVSWRTRPSMQSHADGTFALDGVPPGAVTLEVSARGYAPREIDVVVADRNEPLEISLSTGASIAGKVTKADGVTPIGGTVGLWDLERGSGASYPLNASGTFSFTKLPPGRYRVSAQGEGGTANLEFELARNEHRTGVVLALQGGRSIRGMVTNVRPEDMQRVRVVIRRENDLAGAQNESTLDGGGGYVLRDVPPGPAWIVATLQRHEMLSQPVNVPAESDLTVNLAFPNLGRLHGRVTRRGQPVPGVELSPMSLPEGMVQLDATTSTDGRYVFEELPEGQYRLVSNNYRSPTFTVGRDTQFDIEVPETQLAGRVLEESGMLPVAKADIDVWPVEGSSADGRVHRLSNDSGEFGLSGIEPGDFMISVYKPGYEMFRQRMSAPPSSESMTIRLRQDPGVEVRVRSPDTRDPVREIFAAEMIGARHGTRLTLRVDSDGIARLPAAMAGSTLQFFAERYEPVTVRDWDGLSLSLSFKQSR